MHPKALQPCAPYHLRTEYGPVLKVMDVHAHQMNKDIDDLARQMARQAIQLHHDKCMHGKAMHKHSLLQELWGNMLNKHKHNRKKIKIKCG